MGRIHLFRSRTVAGTVATVSKTTSWEASAMPEISLEIQDLQEELDDEGSSAASWGLKRTIGGLQLARNLILDAVKERRTL
jgi:hypothetical protein